jgi:uncharacterized protein YqjF (DUF2071 family)
MLNYAVDPAVLAPYLPAGVELDEWNGVTYASLVGFLFLDTRLLGASIPYHRDFEEVNLRFYVRRAEVEGWRRGVVFVKEIVPRRSIAVVARAVYGERYVALPMQHRLEAGNGSSPPGIGVEYAWRFGGRWNRLWARAVGEPQPLESGTEREFITEHYWGYTRRRDGRTVEYRVEHPPWRAWQAGECGVELDAGALYGRAFADLAASPPLSAFIAEGSPVTVYRGSLIEEKT